MKLEPGDELLTLDECERLTKRKKSTWRADIRAKKIPYIHLGRLIRIRRSDLNALLTRGFRPSVSVGGNDAA
ncbi:MAG: helix-turn-helix domain-containing protein [Gammaproteobacteria bacterium]